MPEKRALVTGGTRGIGLATALVLVRSGHEVFVTGRSSQCEPPPGCHYLSCDFADLAALERLASTIGDLRLSVLVNNAGINKIGPLSQCDPKDFALIHQVNVTAPFMLCRAVVPGMQSRRFGRIVNIASIFSVVSKEGRSAYSASKFGLVGLSRSLAIEVAADNILVNCLSPGFIDTDLTRANLGPAGMQEMQARVPMQRLGQPEEIARYIGFLASEDNTYMTGQNVIVDGGFTCV